MATLVSTSMALRVGTRKTVLAVSSLAEAQQAVVAIRDRMEIEGRGGASRFPQMRIIDLSSGHTIGHVSYNGRVWEGEPGTWTPSTRELRA